MEVSMTHLKGLAATIAVLILAYSFATLMTFGAVYGNGLELRAAISLAFFTGFLWEYGRAARKPLRR
jgi:hypothetical protein